MIQARRMDSPHQIIRTLRPHPAVNGVAKATGLACPPSRPVWMVVSDAEKAGGLILCSPHAYRSHRDSR